MWNGHPQKDDPTHGCLNVQGRELARQFKNSAGCMGTITLREAEFLDEAVADFVAAESAYGTEIGFALDNGQPGDAVVEHRGGGCQSRVVEGNVHAVIGEEVAQLLISGALGALSRYSYAGDDVIEIVAVESAPEMLVFVDDQEFAGGALVEGANGINHGGVFVEELSGKRIH